MKLSVVLVDKPGSLMLFTELLSTVEANIVHIGYDRTSIDLEFGDATVSVSLETKGVEHQNKIRAMLEENGFKFEEVH
jgi:threonine dehydratase